jgi:hypothetical protein
LSLVSLILNPEKSVKRKGNYKPKCLMDIEDIYTQILNKELANRLQKYVEKDSTQ